MSKPTKKTTAPSAAQKFFQDTAETEYLCYLYGRWQDQKQFEDFQNYIDAFEERLVKFNLALVQMNKRFNIIIEDKKGTRYELKINSRQYGYRQLTAHLN